MKWPIFISAIATLLASCMTTLANGQNDVHSGEFLVRIQDKAFFVGSEDEQACFTAIARGSVGEVLSLSLKEGDPERLAIAFTDLDEFRYTPPSVLDFGQGPFISSAASFIFEGEQYFTDCQSSRFVEILSFAPVATRSAGID